MLYRWFVGLPMHEAPWDHSTFTKNRDRLIEGGTPEVLFDQVLGVARAENLLSDEHFSVDGTLLRAWASQASFVRKDGGGDGDGGNFRGQERSNDTHASTTDPDARLYKKSQGSEAHLAYLGHALTENRHGFAVAATVTHATGTAEREAALTLMDETRPADDTGTPAAQRRTLGADKNYDTGDFVAQCRARNITPHVAQNDRRVGGSAIDGRTTRHAGYAVSRVKRQMAERVHAWPKTWSTMRRAMVRGLDRMKAHYQMSITGGNLMRLVNLTG